MKLTGRDLVSFGVLGIGAYILYRVTRFGDSVGDALNRFWTGLTFDSASLGPAIQLTPGAAEAQTDWIKKGFLEVLPDGGTRITPAGEEYIRQQREKVIQGQVIG